MKKIICLALALSLLCSCFCISAYAGDSISATCALTVNGSSQITAKTGDVITVSYGLSRTDGSESYSLNAIQNEIRFNEQFFQFVNGSIHVNTETAKGELQHKLAGDRIYMNDMPSVAYEAKMVFGTFQLKVIGTTGSGKVESTEYKGYDSTGTALTLKAEDLTVVVSNDCLVSFESNGGTAVAPQKIKSGACAVRPADPTKSGFVFSGWYSDAKFKNPWNFGTPITQNILLYAMWTAVETPPEGWITIPVFNDQNSVSVSASVSGSSAIVSITSEQLQQIATVIAATGLVQVDASSLSVETLVLPQELIQAVAQASDSAAFSVILSSGRITLDAKALQSVRLGNQSLTITMKAPLRSALNAKQQAMLGTITPAALSEIRILSGQSLISTFGNGRATIELPYAAKTGEDTSKLVVWHLAEDGGMTPMGGSYNAAARNITFTTDHLSVYALVTFPFVDVPQSAWSYASVAYAYNNGLFSGTAENRFSPDTVMNRGMLVTVLYRMAGSPVNSKKEAFSDVSSASYYADAAAWAAANGIVSGYGNGKFGPADPVTREQLAAILYRYAALKNVSVSGTGDLSVYTDAQAISAYAREAMQWANGAGLITGRTATTLAPGGQATRAEVAAILQRFQTTITK